MEAFGQLRYMVEIYLISGLDVYLKAPLGKTMPLHSAAGSTEHACANSLQSPVTNQSRSIREVEKTSKRMRTESDPLPVIYSSCANNTGLRNHRFQNNAFRFKSVRRFEGKTMPFEKSHRRRMIALVLAQIPSTHVPCRSDCGAANARSFGRRTVSRAHGAAHRP